MAGPKEETACRDVRVDAAGFRGKEVMLWTARAGRSLSRCSGVQQDGRSMVMWAESLGCLAVI